MHSFQTVGIRLPQIGAVWFTKMLKSLFGPEGMCQNNLGTFRFNQSCSISIFPYQFNINYSVCFLININITINYLQEGLSISILYQLFKKFPYQFQYQYLLSISPYNIVKITNFLSISHCYQYQY